MQVLVFAALLAALCAAASSDESHFTKASAGSEGRGLLDAGSFFKAKDGAAIPEGRGLLDTRRELSTFAANLCAVQDFDVYDYSCNGSGSYPTPACCSGKGSSSSCSTNNNGAGGTCDSDTYLGCCPR